MLQMGRNELIQHELIHAARSGLESAQFEEEFAYSTSTNLLRKTVAPIAQAPGDAVTFTALSLLSVVSDLPIFSRKVSYAGKLPVLGMTAAAIGRLLYTKKLMKYAARVLQYVTPGSLSSKNTATDLTQAILVRLTDGDIHELAQLWRRVRNQGEGMIMKQMRHFVSTKCLENMRWRIINQCYLRVSNG